MHINRIYIVLLFLILIPIGKASNIESGNLSSEIQLPECDENKYFEIVQGVKNNNIQSFFEYGILYYRGICVKKDERQSFYFFSRAADEGHVAAYYNLALMYHLGIGTEKDTDKAAVMMDSLLNIGYEDARIYMCKLKNEYKHFDNDKLLPLIKKYSIDCDVN